MKKITLLLLFILSIEGFSQTIALQSFATGFSSPLDIVHPANDSRLFIVQQGGIIKILNSNGTTNATPFLNLTSLTNGGGERGLLGLAFHPNYATNGLFFVDYTNTAGNTVIARYSVSATDANVANPASGTILMTITQPFSNHNGGCVRFGPDGYLYIGMGDGGSAGDPNGNAQNLTVDTSNPTRVYLGKMLRIDVDTIAGSLNYGFPPTNPFVGQAGKEEIWAYGLRNPWKYSFNRLNGDLWIGDVGQGAQEEVNRVTAPLTAGLNFGWRCYEGNSTYNTSGCAAASTMVFPVTQYNHSTGCSITGGYFYTGSMYPNFANKYFYTDYCDNKIRTFNTVTSAVTTTASFTGNFSVFGEDMNGELYVAGISNGVIYKIIDSSLSNSEFEKNGFSLYPNPAKDSFTIKNISSEFLKSISLYDFSGKLLLSKSLENNQENTIYTSTLSSGMYVVSIETTNGNKYNSKLVVE